MNTEPVPVPESVSVLPVGGKKSKRKNSRKRKTHKKSSRRRNTHKKSSRRRGSRRK